jgi:hypothetical protein
MAMNELNESPKEAAHRLAEQMRSKGFQAVALHRYTDTNGAALYFRMRMKHPQTGKKWIRPFYKNGHGFQMGEPKFQSGKPLYRLHALTEKPGPCYWVEGENKADAFVKLGLLATTSGGAQSDGSADFKPLAGRTVTIWPDNDKPGLEHAERVAVKLRSLGCSVETLDVKALDLPEGGDVVDWLKLHQGATASDLAKLPRVKAVPQVSTPLSKSNGRDPGATITLLQGLNLTPEPIRWLWEGYLARGKLHIIAGAPGTGKTTLALAFAATITAGGRWPDGTRAEPGNILIWSGEDDVRDTLLPRLIAMGADRARVYFVGDVQAEGQSRPFDPSRDMTALELKAKEIGDVRLLIVDPVVNAVSGDSHKNTETRRALQPVVDLASRLDAVALGVSHFSKGTAGRDPIERVTGSIAFGALPRIVFAAAKTTDENAPSKYVFVRSKSNIGPDGGGFGYDLEQVEVPGYPGLFASRVLWRQALEGTARELLATVEAVEEPGEQGEIEDAGEWLMAALAHGSMDARDLFKIGEAQGYKQRTLQRARARIGAQTRREGFGKGSKVVWYVGDKTTIDDKTPIDDHSPCVSPMASMASMEGSGEGKALKNAKDAQAKGVSTFQENEHLSPVAHPEHPETTPEAPAAGPAGTDPEGERL